MEIANKLARKSAYKEALEFMEIIVHGLAKQVPQPRRVPYMDSFGFRHIERMPQQAIVQKLARLVSSLRAALLLMEHGFTQEQASMQRILDEIWEDTVFLSGGITKNEWTPLHDEYLTNFYEEEFDANTAIESTQKRRTVPRQKIRAWIASLNLSDIDPSTHNESSRTIFKAYSGFVHAASPHIMEMYGGDPPQFHMNGLLGTPLHAEYEQEIWNYFYRGICTFGIAAKAFGDSSLSDSIKAFLDNFERQTGQN